MRKVFSLNCKSQGSREEASFTGVCTFSPLECYGVANLYNYCPKRAQATSRYKLSELHPK